MNVLEPNKGKNSIIDIGGEKYKRLPIKTHVITDADNISDVARQYAKEHIIENDVVFISEKAVACSQKRAVPVEDIKPSRLAGFLSKFVYKSPHGIGLSMPETMEVALVECGILRILLAAVIGAIGKLFRRRGWFYKIAGYKARSIDGPTPNTLPPYNKYVVLGPNDPDKTAKEVSEILGADVCIVDINDLGGSVLGVSRPEIDKKTIADILKDNPLGQDREQTPIGIIRKVV